MEVPANYRGYIAQAIEDGHQAGKLLGDPIFQRSIRELAAQFYNDFLNATDDESRREAHAKAKGIEEVYARLVNAFEVGLTTTQRMAATEE